MKKTLIYTTALCASVLSCKRADTIELSPLSSDFRDTIKVLNLEEKYPSMNMVTDSIVHLQAKGKDETQPYGLIQRREPLAMKYRYLPLETTEECLIGHIEQLDSDDTLIFIFDRDNHSALCFSLKDGSFICKYGSSGRGPGEYVALNYMAIDKKRKEVCLLDFNQYKLMYFSYDGEFLREQPQFYAYCRMEFCGGNMVLGTEQSENTMAPSINHSRLILAKPDQTPLFKGFTYAEHLYDEFGFTVSTPFVKCKNDLYYIYELSDTIWQIKENGTCEAKYVFKFPGRDNLFTEKDFQHLTMEEFDERRKNIPIFAGDITITENFIRAHIFNGQPMVYCISTGHYYYGLSNSYIFGIHTTFEGNHTLDGKSFVDALQPFEILQHYSFAKENFNEAQYNDYWNRQLTEEERQLLQKMTPEDNPILMIIDIEPF